jgi:stage III sporulation protein AC
MEVGLIMKIAGTGILVAVAYQVLSKAGRDEQAMLVSLAGVVIVMLVLVREIGGLFESVRTIFGF